MHRRLAVQWDDVELDVLVSPVEHRSVRKTVCSVHLRMRYRADGCIHLDQVHVIQQLVHSCSVVQNLGIARRSELEDNFCFLVVGVHKPNLLFAGEREGDVLEVELGDYRLIIQIDLAQILSCD